MNETLMTEQAATTPESQTASQPAVADSAASSQTPPVDASATPQQSSEGQPEATTTQVKADGAPEAYTEFAMPEGVNMDPMAISSFSEVAKELNLSQGAAQKMIDKMAPAMASRQAELLTQARTEWASAASADKEYGGDKLSANLAVAKKAMDQFGTPELRELLNQSGLGNHPEVIRVFYRAGKAISEDHFVMGQGAPGASNDPAKRLFPNQA